MDTTKDSAPRRIHHPESRAGDPFFAAGDRLAWRVALAMATTSDSCAYCGHHEAGHGDQGELCEKCARAHGVA